jgi:predicted ATPase/DNA-binding CsgD family transcriptional regulator
LAIAPAERGSFIQIARAEQRVDRFAPVVTLDRPRTNLPVPPTTLIGRTREVAQLCALLRTPDVRLLTLTGPGGIGKTRLSFQLAAEVVEEFTDGVYFVDLAPIRDPQMVSMAIAETLGVRETGAEPLLERLKAFLRDKHMLLLLDNFEHLLDAAPLVAELLASAAQLKVLTTSREVLHLRGEQEVTVQPLAVPDTTHLSSLDQLAQYSAVALFIQRVQARQPAFQVSNENARAVAEICVHLDGLPLAIELAAARLKLFAPEALLARLSSRLALLIDGPRDLPTRQQTIRNTIAWSYNLLNETEQTLFRRLAVFVGGFTIEAAEAVCEDKRTSRQADEETAQEVTDAVSRDLRVSWSVLDGIAALVDQSLLRQAEAPAGAARFVMLETIREHALEQFELSGETEALRQQHAAYYLQMAELAEPQLQGVEPQLWLVRLEAEHDNLRTALAWSQGAARNAELGLRLAGALAPFWWTRGYFIEGQTWLEGALARPEAALPTRERAKALAALGMLAVAAGPITRGVQILESSVALYQKLGDQWSLVEALTSLVWALTGRGEDERAAVLADEALASVQRLGDTRMTARLLLVMGWGEIRRQGDVGRAEQLLEQALALYRSLEDKGGINMALTWLADAAQFKGDYRRAQALLDETLSLSQQQGNKVGIAWTLCNLGDIAQYQGNTLQATGPLRESLALMWELEDQEGIRVCLGALAGVAQTTGQLERAARWCGSVQALFDASDYRISPEKRKHYERTVAATRAQLGEAAFAAAWAAGQSLTAEQAVAEAKHMLMEVEAGDQLRQPELPAPSTKLEDGLAVTLTPRERQVLALIAKGFTNRAIADSLVVAERTAEIHVSNVLSKLGVTSRTQAAAYAVAQGLAAPPDP